MCSFTYVFNAFVYVHCMAEAAINLLNITFVEYYLNIDKVHRNICHITLLVLAVV